MEEEKKELVSTYVELTDNLRKMPLYEFANKFLYAKGKSIDYYEELTEKINELIDSGIDTLDDLLNVNTNKLYQILGYRADSFKLTMMRAGFVFRDYHTKCERVGISDYIALVPIQNLELSNRVYNCLLRKGLCFLGDILTYDYEDFLKIRNFGEERLLELKKYIHSLGFSLKGEKIEVKEAIEECKKNNVIMVHEELGIKATMCSILYRNGIYTLDDFLSYGPEVFNLVGMGDMRIEAIQDAMLEKGISFSSYKVRSKKAPLPVMPSKEVVDEVRLANPYVKKQLNTLNGLMHEVEKLLEERRQLLVKEEKLNRMISEKINSIRLNISNGDNGYGTK